MVGFLIVLLIFGWAFYGLHVTGLNQAVLEDISKPLAKWFSEPGNNVRALVALASLLVAIIALSSDSNSYIGQFKGDMLSIAIAVIVIDELASYRSRLERKQEIIEQIESPVRDAAVEAIRFARKSGFLDEALKNVTITNLQLEGADLHGANLSERDLTNANFKDANLENADFQKSNLKNVNFSGALLRDANFDNSSLENSNFEGADLTRANFHAATLWRFEFAGEFISPNFKESTLEKANFMGNILIGLNFEDADLRYACFQSCDLSSANFERASLHDADFQSCFLGGTNFEQAILSGANFRGSIITESTKFKGCFVDGTKWPEGFEIKNQKLVKS